MIFPSPRCVGPGSSGAYRVTQKLGVVWHSVGESDGWPCFGVPLLAEWITRISGTAKPSDGMSPIHTSQSAGLAIVFFYRRGAGCGEPGRERCGEYRLRGVGGDVRWRVPVAQGSCTGFALGPPRKFTRGFDGIEGKEILTGSVAIFCLSGAWGLFGAWTLTVELCLCNGTHAS